MRQVGKTTLLKKFSSDYLSFDDPQTGRDFDRQGNVLLQDFKRTLALDEVQKYPPIFDLIKLNVDRVKKPGRFLVSGSVRFSSRKAIRESLTGRIVLIEIHPFTLAECHSRPESRFLKTALSGKSDQIAPTLERSSWATERNVAHYLETGGLPGICFRRNAAIRYRLFQTHVDTLLGRDIHLIRETSLPLQKLFSLLSAIAQNQGSKVSLANYARLIGVSQPTAKTLFAALEGLFLIKPFGHTHFIEDAGLSHFLYPIHSRPGLWDRIRLLYYHFRVQAVADFSGQVKFAPHSSRGGLFVPFLVEERTCKKLAIFVDESDVPSNKNLLAASLIRKKFPGVTALILTDGKKAFTTAKGVLCLPWRWAF
jgi:hypothetical protein